MFPWIYSAVLTAIGIVYLPKLLWDMTFKKKYRYSIGQRLGIGWPKLPTTPLIWLHAVSMGETRAIAPLAGLIAKRHPHCKLVISSVTETGHKEALRLFPEAAAHLFLPFDLQWIIRPLLKKLSIHTLIFSEGDLWPSFMAACRDQGTKIAVVNGKISERSLQRFLWCGPLRRHLVDLVDLCCVQNDIYADRFRRLGIGDDRLQITGNLKFDPSTIGEETAALSLSLPPSSSPVIVIGSTHHGEEDAILEALKPLWDTFPDLRLIIAPRHPERFEEVWSRFLQQHKEAVRWTTYKHDTSASAASWRILLVDAMGILPHLYSHATIAIVGGSFISSVGGHNIIEPCLSGTPVLFGPFMYKQEEMVSLVAFHSAGLQLAAPADLTTTLQKWLSSPQLLEDLSNHCRSLTDAVRGSTEKTYNSLSSLLPPISCHHHTS